MIFTAAILDSGSAARLCVLVSPRAPSYICHFTTAYDGELLHAIRASRGRDVVDDAAVFDDD